MDTDRRSHKRFIIPKEFQECTFQVIRFGEMRQLPKNPAKGILKDISVGGLRLESQLDFPVRREVDIRISFKLAEQEFNLYGNLAWKLEDKVKFNYGVKFINLSAKQEDTLVSSLQILQFVFKGKRY